MFNVLDSKQTGLDVVNHLEPTDSFNMFNYMYFYNGAGVGAGDFNKDGLIDLFFASNQGQNKLYLNQGNLQFKNVTIEAKIPDDHGWSTGISVVDINNDGLLDIYVCRVGHFETLKGSNQFLICKGINKDGVPYYEDEASQLGLNFSGFSTQAAFFDYDLDGDLDMFLMNHGIRSIGTYGPRNQFLGTYDSLSGDRLYRNDGSHFLDVTKTSGINSSSIGYGLGICVSDINMDGWPDVYVGNDFQENDYLYINQKNGTFKDELSQMMAHSSQFTMGVDVADMNNDGFPDILSLDMLPADPYILKRSLGEDEYNTFQMKLQYGFFPQYARNNLQVNNGDGSFSEIGRYAGMAATDWSWSGLWADFNNDGLKDLFVSNGIPKRLNDMDYVNYVTGESMTQKILGKNITRQDINLINKFPEIKIPNKVFINSGSDAFTDAANLINGDRPSFSNGAVYADLDNDGDLDIVVSNIDDTALVYENKTNSVAQKDYIRLSLKGDSNNTNAIGAKLLLYTTKGLQTFEKFPVHGFQSSMELPFEVGLKNVEVDSAKIIWPDNTWQPLQWNKEETNIQAVYSKGLPKFNYDELRRDYSTNTIQWEDITESTGLIYNHVENNFNEFDREPLIPKMLSKEGPALAVADINHDGLEDVFIGASRGCKAAIFIQTKDGRFHKTNQPALDADSNYEDVSACWVDVNNDGFNDLVVASAGNEYFGTDSNNTPRVYLNNGLAQFKKLSNAFPAIFLTASCIVPFDLNQDGFIDLFIAGRAVPFEYGKTPTSYLLLNDGTGRFKGVTNTWNKELANIGFVTNATWFDVDKDNRKDLLLCCEWGGIYSFLNKGNHLESKMITNNKGWWNFMLPCDIDNDGDIDIVAGNLGLNSRLKATEAQPVRMYYADFDGNGKKEQVLTYYLSDREIPFALKSDLDKQMPLLKKKFLYAEDFAKSSLPELVSKEKLDNAIQLSANDFANSVFINNGDGTFAAKALPWQAQLTCYRDALVLDANGDALPDILMVGNFYANNVQMGSDDANFGLLLLNKGNDEFSCQPVNGLQIRGEVRHVSSIKINGKQAFVLARNNNSVKIIRPKSKDLPK